MTSKLVRMVQQETAIHLFGLNVPILIGGMSGDIFSAPSTQLKLSVSVVSSYGTHCKFPPQAKRMGMENALDSS